MLPLRFAGNQAAFYRVYQKDDTHQIALVLLNKGDAAAQFDVSDFLQAGRWTPALGGNGITVAEGGRLRTSVAAHDVQVYLLDAVAKRADLVAELTRLMQERGHPAH
jgi:hypothetical protein